MSPVYFYFNMTSPWAGKKVIFAISLVTALVAVGVVLVTSNGGGGSAKDRPQRARPREQVDLAARIDDFTRQTIRRSAFRPPTALERRAVADGVGLYLDGRRAEAGRRLAEVDFGVSAFTDTATGRPFAEFADRARESTRGWGRVYVDLPQAGRPAAKWSVQVPHPVADADSEKLGVGRGAPHPVGCWCWRAPTAGRARTARRMWPTAGTRSSTRSAPN